MSSIVGHWDEGFLPSSNSNLAVAMFLVMVCTMEVIIMKLAAAPAFNREVEFDNSSEYEEDIYYEELYDNYSIWPNRRRPQVRSGIQDNLDYYQ